MAVHRRCRRAHRRGRAASRHRKGKTRSLRTSSCTRPSAPDGRHSSASTSARPASRRWPSPRPGTSSRAPSAGIRSQRRSRAGASRIPTTGGAASQAALADLGVEPGAIGLSGQMHGLVALDERDRPSAARNPLERPADRRRVRGDRGDDRARPAHRAHRQPRAHRLHRAEAPLAETARARDVRAHPPRAAPQGLRAAAPHGRACDRCGRRVGDAALRRAPAGLERRGPRRARASRRVAPARARVDGDRRRRRPGGGRARARRRPARAALRRARDVGSRLRGAARVPSRRPRAAARLLPCGAGHVARDGRHALRRGLAALAARQRRRRELRGAEP